MHELINTQFILEIDLIPGLAAFIACLVLPLELGILIGIGINVIFILYHAARPKINIDQYSVSQSFPLSLKHNFNYACIYRPRSVPST